MESIYVKESDVPLTKTRKNLIRHFLRGKSIPSYSNKECTILQCDGKGNDTGVHAYRSITDLHAIVCGRFPKTSIKAVVRIIYELIEEDKAVCLVWCKMINKVVVKYIPNKSGKWITDISRNNYYDEKGVDGYSLRDYEEIKKEIEQENY